MVALPRLSAQIHLPHATCPHPLATLQIAHPSAVCSADPRQQRRQCQGQERVEEEAEAGGRRQRGGNTFINLFGIQHNSIWHQVVCSSGNLQLVCINYAHVRQAKRGQRRRGEGGNVSWLRFTLHAPHALRTTRSTLHTLLARSINKLICSRLSAIADRVRRREGEQGKGGGGVVKCPVH